jgi:hypothetical protein
MRLKIENFTDDEIDTVLPGNIRDFHVAADPIQPMAWSAHRRDGWRRG